MTSDIAKPQTEPEAKLETFRSHLPAIVAATTGTVLAAILGSLIGAAGTIVGIVIGSLASGTASWWAERGIRRSAALAAARAEALRARGHPLHLHEGAVVIQPDAAAQDDVAAARAAPGRLGRPRPGARWAGLAAIIVAAFIGGVIVVTLVEGAAGKPLSAVVQGKPGHGMTVTGGAVGTTAPASPSPTPTGSTTGAAATAPGTGTTPSDATNSPATSTTPTPTTSDGTNPASTAPNSATPSAAATTTAPG